MWLCVSICRALCSALGDHGHQQAQKAFREAGGLQLLTDLLRGGEYAKDRHLDNACLRALLGATGGYIAGTTRLTHHGVNARMVLRLGGAEALYRLLLDESRGGLKRSAQLALKLVINLALEAHPEEVKTPQRAVSPFL